MTKDSLIETTDFDTQHLLKIRVVSADENEFFRDGFASVMMRFGIIVECSVARAHELIDVYSKKRPQVIVLDIQFGNKMSGLDIAKKLLRNHPDANIVFLSHFDQVTLIRDAYRLGARAFLNKNSAPRIVVDAVIAASKGDKFYPPDVLRLYREFVEGGRSPQEMLDERKMTIFTAIACGQTLTEIAPTLGLSIKTISVEAKEIKKLLAARNDSDLTRLAIKHGQINLD